MKISVITTVFNEEENIEQLIKNIDKAMATLDYEVVVVDDGSTDNSVDVLKNCINSRYKIIILNRNFGQTAAIAAGIDNAEGEFIITMDADLQNDPSDIPMMLDLLIRKDLDMVVGNRKRRKDSFLFRKIPSKMANYLIRNMSGVHVHDYGCTLKVFRKETARNLRLYGELHRFIPILAHLDGARIAEVNVNHHPRLHGKSKYGIGRTMKVISDLILLLFIQKYMKRPIHLFGPIAIFSIAGGLAINFYLLVLKLQGEDIWGRPILILGAILLLGGIQLITFGIITELTMRVYYESQRKETYKIRRIIRQKPAQHYQAVN